MDKKTYTEYDLTTFYNEEIAPRINEIQKLCTVKDLPFVFSCCISNTDNKSIYKNEGNMPGSNELELFEDKLTPFLLFLRGAKIASIADISYDDEMQGYVDNVPEDDETSFEEDLVDANIDEEEMPEEELAEGNLNENIKECNVDDAMTTEETCEPKSIPDVLETPAEENTEKAEDVEEELEGQVEETFALEWDKPMDKINMESEPKKEMLIDNKVSIIEKVVEKNDKHDSVKKEATESVILLDENENDRLNCIDDDSMIINL